MKSNTTFALGLITATVMAFPAFAQGQQQHHGGFNQGPNQNTAEMGNEMGAGMENHKQMMMRMHSQMMGKGGMGVMGGMEKSGIGPADGMMIGGMKMPMMDADNDGMVTAEEARAGLTTKLKEFDADGDGALSIAEFETLHSANIREQMVDRFQGFDNDGDGLVTLEEMTAPASRMERMQGMKDQASNMGQSMQNMGSTKGDATGNN